MPTNDNPIARPIDDDIDKYDRRAKQDQQCNQQSKEE